jgi:hypothetical protein
VRSASLVIYCCMHPRLCNAVFDAGQLRLGAAVQQHRRSMAVYPAGTQAATSAAASSSYISRTCCCSALSRALLHTMQKAKVFQQSLQQENTIDLLKWVHSLQHVVSIPGTQRCTTLPNCYICLQVTFQSKSTYLFAVCRRPQERQAQSSRGVRR